VFLVLVQEIIIISISAGDGEKNLTAEHAETAEIFFPKGQKHKRFKKIPSSLRPPGSLRFLAISFHGGIKILFPWTLRG
jgi:hypothetical protein